MTPVKCALDCLEFYSALTLTGFDLISLYRNQIDHNISFICYSAFTVGGNLNGKLNEYRLSFHLINNNVIKNNVNLLRRYKFDELGH